ncbi:MAG: phosphatase PAP2 family protein [Pelobium sp.]
MRRIKLLLFFALPLITALNAQSQEVNFGFKQHQLSGFKRFENREYTLKEAHDIANAKDFNLKSKTLKYLPILFIAYGFTAIESNPLKQVNYEFREEILENNPSFRTHIDNYLQYSPLIATFAFKLSGNSGRSNFINSVRTLGMSAILMGGTVYGIKKITGELRPDGSDSNSFPSGHTATAFVSAELLHQEFKETAPLLSYTGYLAASATGVLRMYNNKHYFSDVLAGAGIGILSTKAAYWLNGKMFHHK